MEGRSSWKTSCDALTVRQTQLSQSKLRVTKGTLCQPVNKVPCQEKDRASSPAMGLPELEQAACSPEDTGAGGSALSLGHLQGHHHFSFCSFIPSSS